MNVFSAGIVWDPREPLPPEYLTAPHRTKAQPLHIFERKLHSCASQAQDQTQRVEHATPVSSFAHSVVQEPDRNILPAVSVSLEVQITGDVAEVTAKQVFWNDADVFIHQGAYTFALPNGCTVTGFTCRVGKDKVLKAEARPKAEAREAFDRAVSAHATAALLEQNTPEIFTSSLGNIPPNTSIKAEITYVTILKRRYGDDKNTTTLTIPTYIANRYGQRPVDLQGTDLESKPSDISLHIEILESENIHSIKSESHEILVERGAPVDHALTWDDIGKKSADTKPESAIIKLKEATSWLDADFNITIETSSNKGHAGPEAWLEFHPSFENQAAMMVTLPPRMLLSQNERPGYGEILFVVDRSGSMEDKMGNLRSAMHFFLKGIPLGWTFNIWSFGTNYISLWSESQTYGEESLRMALNHVETEFHADMGGTELLPALWGISNDRDGSLLCDVIILTDGEVWRLDETLDLVRVVHESSQGRVRFFALGIGAHVSHALVEGIAKQGGGYSEVVPRASEEGLEERLLAMLQAALTCHVSNVRLNVGGLRAMTSPPDLRLLQLNPFQAHRVFLLLDQGCIPEDGSVTIESNSDGRWSSLDVPNVRLQKPGTLIHSLSARAILSDLEQAIFYHTDYTATTGWRTKGKEADAASLAEMVACKYSLPSKWTSLFLQQEDDKASEGERLSSNATIISISSVEDNSTRLLQLQQQQHQFQQEHQHQQFQQQHYEQYKQQFLQYKQQQQQHHQFQPQYYELYEEHEQQLNILPYEPEDQQHQQQPLLLLPTSSLNSEESFATPLYSRLDLDDIVPPSDYKDRLSVTLSHQRFDGSFSRRVLDEALESDHNDLKRWLCMKTSSMNNTQLDLVAIAALVVKILEQGYQDHKNLWVMMHEKALQYILGQVSDPSLRDELLECTGARLKTLSESFSLNTLIASSKSLGESPVELISSSERVLVDVAPLE